MAAVAAVAHPAPAGRPPAGARIAVLTIERLHARLPVYEGTAQRVLAKGPGHYVGTSLPGQSGTVGIAGHRVTHTHPFLRITLIRRGDVIRLSTRQGVFRYRVNALRVVSPNATWVLFRGKRLQRLVLTTCHPAHSSRYRYVVMATRIR